MSLFLLFNLFYFDSNITFCYLLFSLFQVKLASVVAPDRVGELVKSIIAGFAKQLTYLGGKDANITVGLKKVWTSGELVLSVGSYTVLHKYFFFLIIIFFLPSFLFIIPFKPLFFIKR